MCAPEPLCDSLQSRRIPALVALRHTAAGDGCRGMSGVVAMRGWYFMEHTVLSRGVPVNLLKIDGADKEYVKENNAEVNVKQTHKAGSSVKAEASGAPGYMEAQTSLVQEQPW